MASRPPAYYAVGQYILFAPVPSRMDEFVLGRVTKVLLPEAAALSRSSSGGAPGSHPGSARNTPREEGRGGGAAYDVAPQLTCHTIASKKTPGKQLARAVRYLPIREQQQGGKEGDLLEKSDVDELNERRLQLQLDVDTSKARVAEIDLYIESLAQSQAEARQRSTEAVAAADKGVLLARAALRAAKPADWKRLLERSRVKGGDSSQVLAAVVEAALALTGAAADGDEKELEKKVMALKPAAALAKHKKGLKKAEQCLSKYPSRSVPAEQALLCNLYKWMQAVVAAARAYREREDMAATATAVGGEVQEAGAERAAATKPGTRESSPNPRQPAVSAEVAKLRAEQAEHEEYIALAVEELVAIDELIKESKAALAGEGLILRVPASQVAGAVPNSKDLQGILKAAMTPSQASGEPVKLTMKVGTEMADLMTHYRLNAATAKPVPARRSASRVDSGSSSPRGPRSVGGTQPNSARHGGDSPGPEIPPLPLAEMKAQRSISFKEGRGTPGDSQDREDALDQSLRLRFEKINSTPRLPTPRLGPPLLEDSATFLNRSTHRLSGSFADPSNNNNTSHSVNNSSHISAGGDADGGSPHSQGQKKSPRTASTGGGVVPAAVAAHERLAYQQKINELELRLERALQANPKEAELQLLRDELKGTQQDLRRITEERDSLVKERREKSHFSVLSRRMVHRPSLTTAPSESEEENSLAREDRARGSGHFGDLVIIEELEEQLNAAHRRIRELEAHYSNTNSTPVPATAPATAAAAMNANASTDSKGPVVSMPALSSPPPPPSGLSTENMAAFNKAVVAVGAASSNVSNLGDDSGDTPLTLSPGVLAEGLQRDGGSHDGDPSSAPPSPELTAAQRKVQAVLAQLAQEQQTRQELQAKMEAMQKEIDISKRNSQDLEERLNLALHAREQSQAQADQQRRELDVMWARLEETEAELHEHRERESIARAQQAFMTEESLPHGGDGGGGAYSNSDSVNAQGVNMMSLPSVIGRAANAELSSDPPSMYLSAGTFLNNAGRNNLEDPRHDGANRAPTVNRVPNTDAEDPDLSRASSPAFANARDASQSPQPMQSLLGGGGAAGGSSRAVSTQPVENMSAVELRHEVRQLRGAVEALQSNELRLSTELNGLREKQKDERRRRQQARTVRLQMLNRLQEAVQQAMDTGSEMATVPEILERTREGTEAIMAHRRMSR